jgi:hypothetical protein
MASSISLPSFAAKSSNILNPDGTSIDQSFAPVNGGMFRNRIINGDMRIDQRNNGGVVIGTLGYITDRWACLVSQASKITGQQNAGSVTPPVGFTNYLGMTSTSAYSSLSGDYFFLTQKLEGLNISDLAWGSANAVAVTLSFRVYSSLTGTFSGAITNSAENRSYPFTYSVSAANTWTTISVTIPGDTSGTWLTTNGTGIAVKFNLGSGSTRLGTAGAWAGSILEGVTGSLSVVGTNGATFYVTGVQLERGSSATPFEFRPIGTELALCQRYYESLEASAFGVSSTAFVVTPWKVTKRGATTLTVGLWAANAGNTPITSYSAARNQSPFEISASPATNGAIYFVTVTGSSEL